MDYLVTIVAGLLCGGALGIFRQLVWEVAASLCIMLATAVTLHVLGLQASFGPWFAFFVSTAATTLITYVAKGFFQKNRDK
jgi:hypothetical protein